MENLPFNPSNIVISEADVSNLLNAYSCKHIIKNINLFRCAMVHRSYCTRKNESITVGNERCPNDCIPLQDNSNERLEFLGDAVLNLIVGGYLFERYDQENEGFLTKIRTKLVCGRMLSELAAKIDIKQFFIISKQIEDANGRENAKILEDMFEAFLGALYLDADHNIDIVAEWLMTVIETNVDFTHLILHNDNPKDCVIRYFQHTFGFIPKFEEYNVEFIDGKKQFKVCLRDSASQISSIGSGSSKKKAENDCAQRYLDTLSTEQAGMK
jgi:dsRNA-specific ribonuclease